MKIPEYRRVQLKGILGITTIGGGGKYLGLPEQIGRNKVDQFEYVVTRIREKINMWYCQLLSPAGKEGLIKSVIQAKPFYPMHCFLLPKTICDEINGLLSKFWWGKDKGQRKNSWVAWKRLSLPKSEGGLGFKDLYIFNFALLAKQFWCILQNPTTLLVRLYKGRYFNTSTFLQSKCGSQPSYGWRSVQAEKSLLLEGLRFNLGMDRTQMFGLTNGFLQCHQDMLQVRFLIHNLKFQIFGCQVRESGMSQSSMKSLSMKMQD